MQISFIKKILIAACVVMLFGCGEEDEAKKLGFASVDEMNVAHAKGWHTQQKYYEDNGIIKNDEKKLTNSPSVNSAKEDPFKGWRDYTFADGKFTIKYPAKLGNSSDPDCKKGNATICSFKIFNEKNVLVFTWVPSDLPPVDALNSYITKRQAMKQLLEPKDINVKGIDGKDFTELDGNLSIRTRIFSINNNVVELYGMSYSSSQQEVRDVIEQFINSFAPVKLNSANKVAAPATSDGDYYSVIRTYSKQLGLERVADCAVVANTAALSLTGDTSSNAILLKLSKIFAKAYNDMSLQFESRQVKAIADTYSARRPAWNSVESMNFLGTCVTDDSLVPLMQATHAEMKRVGNAP